MYVGVPATHEASPSPQKRPQKVWGGGALGSGFESERPAWARSLRNHPRIQAEYYVHTFSTFRLPPAQHLESYFIATFSFLGPLTFTNGALDPVPRGAQEAFPRRLGPEVQAELVLAGQAPALLLYYLSPSSQSLGGDSP